MTDQTPNPLTPEQWRQAWEIFKAAEGVPEADREAFLASRCGDSAVLARIAALFDQEHEEDEPVRPERAPGERIGRYVLDREIGRGSYGEVWSGRDVELGRRVALKFISPERQGDRDATRRLLREARAASALNHPNIVVVHEVIASDSGPVIVMELVEGAPLRSAMGAPLAAAKAHEISAQILRALAFAHAAGVVHGDLKPENIVVRPDGLVKVLDFGLARQTIGGAASSTMSVGLSLGTLRYMSPEQCEGATATPASDVFAAGVILYELQSGVHPFESNSWLDTVNAIVKCKPKPLDGPASALAMRMLGKAAADRPSAAEAAQFWDTGAAPIVHRRKRWMIPAVAAGVAVLTWFGLTRANRTSDPNLRLTDTRLDLGSGVGLDERNFALSPDGRKLIFHGGNALYVLDLAGGPAVELKGVAGQYPFWSPDGKEFGYFANGKLWRKGFPDGASREICDAPSLSSAHWGSNDIILFASSSDAPISRVRADGGKPVQVIPFEPGAKRHEAPYLLPDGRHFVYWSASNRRIGNLMLADLDGAKSPRELARTASSAIYLPRPGSAAGALVYRANGGLMLLPFDSEANQVIGAPKMIAERTSRVNHKIVPAAVSARGDLVYRETEDRRIQVKIFDRRGQLLAKVAEAKEYTAATPSPDFKRLALISEDLGTGQRVLEFYNMETGVTTSVPEAVAPGNPTWAPDGSTLMAGNGSVSGGADFYRIAIPNAGPPVVKKTPWKKGAAAWPSDWSQDGKNVVLIVDDPQTNFDIWALPLDGGGDPRPLLATPAREQRASLSPDGKLLLYMSDESKSSEIWVTPNPPDGRKWKVSTAGGQEPHWRGDGKEIFYQSMDYALMAVRVGGTSTQPSFTKPELLFGGRSGEPALMVWHCEPSADGQRFAILTGPIQSAAAPLRLRLNWWAEGR